MFLFPCDHLGGCLDRLIVGAWKGKSSLVGMEHS
jgi:hypothetical protein